MLINQLRKEHELIDLFCNLAEIPSPSLHEENVAKFIKNYCEQNNMNCRFDDYGNVRIDIPATDMAMEMNITKLANMIVLGKIVKETGILPIETVISGLEQMTPKRKEHLLEPNKNAIMAGYNH